MTDRGGGGRSVPGVPQNFLEHAELPRIDVGLGPWQDQVVLGQLLGSDQDGLATRWIDPQRKEVLRDALRSERIGQRFPPGPDRFQVAAGLIDPEEGRVRTLPQRGGTGAPEVGLSRWGGHWDSV